MMLQSRYQQGTIRLNRVILMTVIWAMGISYGLSTRIYSNEESYLWLKLCLKELPSGKVQDPIKVWDLVYFLEDYFPAFIPPENYGIMNHSVFDIFSETVRYHFLTSSCSNNEKELSFCQLDDDQILARSVTAGSLNEEDVQLLRISSGDDAKQELCLNTISSIEFWWQNLDDANIKDTLDQHIRLLSDDDGSSLMDYEAFEASSTCTCIDTPEFILQLMHDNKTEVDPDFISASSYIGSYCFPWSLLTKTCYNPDTGKEFISPDECRKLALNDDRVDEQCCSNWCFVDTNNCTMPHQTLSYLMENQYPLLPLPPDIINDNVFISYETCGNVNYYGQEEVLGNLKEYELRVGIPGDSSDGYTLTTLSSNKRSGSIYDFMSLIWVENSMQPWSNIEITNKSRTRYPGSSYTACVHDIALGEIDMCIGAFWTTTERLLMSSFTNSIYNDEFYLIVFKDDGTSFLDLVERPFKPFEGLAWLAIVIAFTYMAITVTFIQQLNDSNGDEDSQFKKTLKSSIGIFGEGIYYGLNSFTRGEVMHGSETPYVAERIVTAGFVLFALIVLTAYTATSAAFMVDSSQSGQFQNIQDVLNVQGRICIPEAVSQQFGDLRLDAKTLLVPKMNTEKIFEEMNSLEDGTCVAAILDLDGFTKNLVKSDDNCNKTIVGDVLMLLGNAIPINARYREDINYIVDLFVSNGSYKWLKDDAVNEFLGSPTCSTGNEGSIDASEPTLTVGQLIFPLFITAFCTSLGLFIDWREDNAKIKMLEEQKSYNKGDYSVVDKGDLELVVSNDNSSLGSTVTHTNGDAYLNSKVRVLPVSTIIRRLEDANVDETLRNQAINSLPNTNALSELLYSTTCSKEKMILKTHLDIAKLLSVAQKSGYFDVDSISLNSLDAESLKMRIIDFIMQDRNLRILSSKMIENNEKGVASIQEANRDNPQGSMRDLLDDRLAIAKSFSVNDSTKMSRPVHSEQASQSWYSKGPNPPNSKERTHLPHSTLIDEKISPMSHNTSAIKMRTEFDHTSPSSIIIFSFPHCQEVNHNSVKELFPKNLVLSTRVGIVSPISKHAETTYEAIRIEICDETEEALERVLEIFFKLHDPTGGNFSAIFTTRSYQSKLVKALLKRMQGKINESWIYTYIPVVSYGSATKPHPLSYKGQLIQTEVFRASKFRNLDP